MPLLCIFSVPLGIIGSILFYFNDDIQFKKKYFRWYVVLVGFLFLLLAGVGQPWQVILFFMLPSISLIIYLNIKYTTFCDHCGRIIYKNLMMSNPWSSKVIYCPKCGAKLEN
jgi:hypothetical protein